MCLCWCVYTCVVGGLERAELADDAYLVLSLLRYGVGICLRSHKLHAYTHYPLPWWPPLTEDMHYIHCRAVLLYLNFITSITSHSDVFLTR